MIYIYWFFRVGGRGMEAGRKNTPWVWLVIFAFSFLLPGPATSQEGIIDEPYVAPYEGMWVFGSPKEEGSWYEFGSGVMLAQQDDTLVVTVFTYREDGSPVWYLASGPLKEGVLETDALEFQGGACLGCEWQPAESAESIPVRIEVTSRMLGRLTWGEGGAKPIRALAFDSPLLDMFFAESDLFGTPYIYDMRGLWFFVEANRNSGFYREADFRVKSYLEPGPGMGGIGGATDWNTVQESTTFSFGCKSEHGSDISEVPYCTFTEYGPPEYEHETLFSSYWGDNGPQKLTGYLGDPVSGEEGDIRGSKLIRGFRLTGPSPSDPSDDINDADTKLPVTRLIEKGMWFTPGEPGSGIMLDRQNNTLVFAIFTYDQSADPVWYQGSGSIEDGVVRAQASRFGNGTCLNCEYADSHEILEAVPVEFEFTSKTTAYMTFDGGKAKPMRTLAFDVPVFREFGEAGEFGRPFLQDLRGDWVFISTDGQERFFRRVSFTTPAKARGGDAVSWKNDDGTVMFLCLEDASQYASPQCRLLEHDGDQWRRQFSAYWADVGEDQIIGYEGHPLSGEEGVTRGEKLIYGFRLSGPSP